MTLIPYRAIFTTADVRPSWLLLDFNAADYAHARAYAVSLSGDPALPEWGALTLQRVVKLAPRDVGPTPYRFLPIAGPVQPPWADVKGRRR
jgi:hypothetical protein